MSPSWRSISVIVFASFSLSPVVHADDPFLWLEDVEGERALAWVRERNAETESLMAMDETFTRLERDLRDVLDSDARIPYVSKLGAHYYNFWRDGSNPRGIWRRTTLNEYKKAEPAWETLIDLDALNEAEGENWVWHGADCLKPEYRRCLVSLSRGGADADVTREFDLVDKTFVKDGFFRPESKGGMTWIDGDHVYVHTDFGPGSTTESGYPRLVKLWRRGTPLDDAALVFEGRPEDVSVYAARDHTAGYERDFVRRAIGFYEAELYLRRDEELIEIEAPKSANKSVHREWLLLELREPYSVDGKSWPSGALIATHFEAFLEGKRDFVALFEPTRHESLAGHRWTRNHLLLNVLDDVKNRLYVLTPPGGSGTWKREPLSGVPAIGTISAWGVDDEESDDYFLTVNDYLTPPTLMLGKVGAEPEILKTTPAFFDASPFEVSQYFATSRDGTRVPYFMVAPKTMNLDGSNPTLLYGYGGFEVSLTPNYAPLMGRGWLSAGGVYVVANIRGGGEYGPAWHQAALRENRMRAYEDFAAVADDLVERGVTKPRRLGIQGGSNGGLLMGNMLTHYPEKFGAVLCQVPLLDMKRYHRLLAGASWMAEYGDPDDPEQWTFIRTFSPYQNVDAEADYPPVLFTTSTRDDRVHPGHARKMMASMAAQGHDVHYYENIEGGHGGAADNAQLAHMQALGYRFLQLRLMAGSGNP